MAIKEKKSLLDQFIELRHIDKMSVSSVERNIRACYPQLPENKLEQMVIRNLSANLENCTGPDKTRTTNPAKGQSRNY